MSKHRVDFMEKFHKNEYLELPLLKKVPDNDKIELKI